MQSFAKVMRFLARVICIVFVDFIALQTIVKSYDMKMSVRVCWAIMIFLILSLASVWLGKEDNDNNLSTKNTISIILIICIALGILGTIYVQRYGNSEFEAAAAYIGYKLPILVGANDSEERLRVLQESVQRSPTNITYNIEYAYQLIEQGMYDEAERTANRIIDLDPSNADGYAIRGVCYFYGHIGDDHEETYDTLAYNDLKKAINIGDTQIETLYCYGWLCYSWGEYQDAESVFDMAINQIEAFFPDKTQTPALCSRCYYFYSLSRFHNEGQYDSKQERALEYAINIRPFSNYYIELGKLYSEYDTPEYYLKAKECFDQAVKLEPTIYTHEWRGWFYANKYQMPDEAKKDYQFIVDYYYENELPDDETIARVRRAISYLNN